MDTKDKNTAGCMEPAENDDKRTIFDYGGKRTYRPFDMTLDEFCKQKSLEKNKNEDINIRYSFSERLKNLDFFEDQFFTNCENSRYRFHKNSNDSESSSNGQGATVINLPCEAMPLLWAYSETQVKKFNNKNKHPSIERKNGQLNAYMNALQKETGELFSLFRDTDPLYQQLVSRDFLLTLLPERMVLLTASLLLAPIKQKGALLYAITQAIDTLTSENLKSIFCDYDLKSTESVDLKIEKIQKGVADSLNLPNSVKNLFLRLEGDRLVSSESIKIQIGEQQFETFGLNLSPELNADEIELLEPLFLYLNSVFKEDHEKRASTKTLRTDTNTENKAMLETAARKAYDQYRVQKQDEKIINEAYDFRKYHNIFTQLQNMSDECNNDKKLITHLQIAVFIKLVTSFGLFENIPADILYVVNTPISLMFPLLNVEYSMQQAIDNINTSTSICLKWKVDVDNLLQEINDSASSEKASQEEQRIYNDYFYLQTSKYVKKSSDFLFLIEQEIFIGDAQWQGIIENLKNSINELSGGINLIKVIEEGSWYVTYKIVNYCEEWHVFDERITHECLLDQVYSLPIFHVLFDHKTKNNIMSLWNEQHNQVTTLRKLSEFFSFFMKRYCYKCSCYISKQIVEESRMFNAQKAILVDKLFGVANIDGLKEKDAFEEIRAIIGEMFVKIYNKDIMIDDPEKN